MSDVVKLSELRIGNCLRILGDIDPYFVLQPYHFYEDDEAINHSSPIPLTEEWILKFGFYKFNNAWELKRPKYHADFNFTIWEDLTYNTAELNAPIKYVHQLQNLYFALTGEELTIKE